MTTLAQNHLASAEAYYQAMNDKDPSAIAALVHPDIQLVSPMATVAGKSAFLEATSRFMSQVKSVEIKARFSAEQQAMLTYDADFGPAIGICRSAVLMTFRDALISRIELFFDARPFAQF